MSYDFTYTNSVIGKLYALRYHTLIINTYNFTYDRNITSDLNEYNSPIFLSLEARRVILHNNTLINKDVKSTDIPKSELVYKNETGTGILTQCQFFKELYEKPELALFKYILLSDEKNVRMFRQGLFLCENKDLLLNINYKNIFLSNDLIVNYYNDYIFSTNIHTDLNLFNGKWFIVRYRDIIAKNKLYSIEIATINELDIYNKFIGLINNTLLNKYGYIIDNYSLYKKYSHLNALNTFKSLSSETINGNIYNDYLLSKHNDNNTYIGNMSSIYVKYKDLFIPNYYSLEDITGININILDFYFLYSHKKNICLNNNKTTLSLDSKITYYQDFIDIYKDNNNSTFIMDEYQLNRDRLSMSIDEHSKNIYRVRNVLNEEITFNTGISIFRKRLGFVIDEQCSSIYKENNPSFVLDTDSIIENISRSPGVYINKDIPLKRKQIDTSINDTDKSMYKVHRDISINAIDIELTRYILPLYVDYSDNATAFIINSRNVYYDKDNMFFSVLSKEIFCKDLHESLEKQEKAVNAFNKDIFILKDSQRAFLERFGLYNTISKYTHNLHIIFKDTLIDKDDKQLTLDKNKYVSNITKNTKDIFITYDYFVDKNLKSAFMTNDLTAQKVLKTTILEDYNVHASKLLKTTSLPKDYFITKQLFNAFYQQDFFVIKDSYQIALNDNEMAIGKLEKGISIDNPLASLSGLSKEIDVSSSYLLLSRDNYEAYINKTEIEDLQKIHKDLSNPDVQKYNWAYVYQFDDPIDPNYDYYGLDELLLPEEDIDYSYYESLIYDKNTFTPKNYIKLNEDGSFIAKLPIEHPIKNLTLENPDVYRDYEISEKYSHLYDEDNMDSSLIAMQYIDIPSELMRDIYLAFFKIWYANIFKFGNMQMVDSLRLMLKYIYTHIIETYSGTKYFREALRVFRQIRWFGEKSILNNARYIVKPVFKDYDANGDLVNNICKVPYNAKNFTIDNLRRGFELIYSSNPNYSLEFTITNKSTIILNINIAVTNCDVDVYINDIYQGNIDGSSGRVKEKLEYSIDKRVKINSETNKKEILANKIKFVVNNVDIVGQSSEVLLANIKVHNYEFSHLSIDYDPELRSGNVPMDEIVKKMIIFANMCDDDMINEAYQQYRKGNLGISELYKELVNYWELHHQNKIKGKRLTIKEV